MTVRHAVLVLLTLSVAACSGGDTSSRDAQAEAAIENTVAQRGAHQAARSGLPVAPGAVVADRKVLPVGFQGYWGRTPADCDLTIPDARGRLAIDGDVLRELDTRARVETTVRSTPREVVIDLTVRGDGAVSSRRTTLSLVAGGTALMRTDQGGGQPVRYQHC